jgi:Holliday junction DNA helicase RuvA
MISSLFGRVRSLSSDRAVIEVGGVGLSVVITPVTSARLSLGSDIQLFTSLIVREDSLTLYGFFDDESRELFELVQTVSGIGPRVAMSILAVMSPDDLGSAVAQENIAAIERVPGIGRKGAQRMILELKGKISASPLSPIGHLPAWRDQLSSALVSLGFSPKEADLTMSALVLQLQDSEEDPSQMELSDLLKRALQKGSRGRSS